MYVHYTNCNIILINEFFLLVLLLFLIFNFLYLCIPISHKMMVECYVGANILRKQKYVKINENQQILVFIIIIFDKLCFVMYL